MNIELLKSLLPPPPEPIAVPSQSDIGSFEQQFTKLPTDFVDFLQSYGTGSIDNFIWIFNPASKNPNLNLANQIKLQLQTFRELVFQQLEPSPYKLFPEKEGLLPFAITDNGNVLFWKTVGDPNQWSVVVAASRAPKYEEYNLCITDFISKLLMKELHVGIFPDDFPSEQPIFSPA
jgi:hypothetical protein